MHAVWSVLGIEPKGHELQACEPCMEIVWLGHGVHCVDALLE